MPNATSFRTSTRPTVLYSSCAKTLGCMPWAHSSAEPSIDELPNFVNVLMGDMAIVGPRPPLPEEVEHYDAHAMRRLTVRPGVTCLWQISGRCELSFEQWMALDNAYIDTWTPLGDFAIIARTIPAVVRGVGAH